MDENPIGSLWQPMPFVGEKNAYAWEIFIINYITASLFLHQMEAIVFTILQIYFDMQRKMFMNSLLFNYSEGSSLFSVLWSDFMNKETCSFFHNNNTMLFILN